jgi:hypothetical protein
LATTLVAQSPSPLTQKDVNEAIEWGLRNPPLDPSPYLIHHLGSTSTHINQVITGAVYTPFLRVALAAKAARAEGRTFTPSDVWPKLIEPVIYIAFRWYAPSDEDCFPNRSVCSAPTRQPPPDGYHLAVPGTTLFSPPVPYAAPMWIASDLSLLSSFGGDPPYEELEPRVVGNGPHGDFVLLAGYPMNVFSISSDFVIYRDNRATSESRATGRRAILGHVMPDDLKRWR